MARFDGGTITSDGGAVLLRQLEQRTGIVRQFAACFRDHRQAAQVEHSVRELVAQRVYGLALGYEDLNDHDQLRCDPLLALLSGKQDLAGAQRRRPRDRGKAGAGKSTLNRLGVDPGRGRRVQPLQKDRSRHRRGRPSADRALHPIAAPPTRAASYSTSTPPTTRCTASRKGAFSTATTDTICYLPLYIFAGDQLLCARLRPANIDAAAGALEEVRRIVEQLRRVWPDVEILLRADGGFCRDEMLSWCEANAVGYVIGLPKNGRLQRHIQRRMKLARRRFAKTGKAARAFGDFRYRTRTSWSRRRRVVAKAEYLAKGENPRFVVTSLTAKQAAAQEVYETIYCARRGDGKPHQRAADGVVRRPHVDGRIPVESDPLIFFIDRILCSSKRCGGWGWRGRRWRGRNARRSGYGCSRSERGCGSRRARWWISPGERTRLGGGVRASV